MKRIGSFLSVLVLVGTVGAGAARASEGVIEKEEVVPGSNYCHMKFPAIRDDLRSGDSLFSDNPVLKSSTTGDIIDFYGPCDEEPLGKDQVWTQKLQHELDQRDSYVD